MRAWPLAMLLVLLCAGCGTPAARASCGDDRPSPGATAYDCVATSDGWYLRVATWDPSASRVAVLVHGLNEDHHSYDALAQALASNGWRVIAFDSRGHGASTHRTDGTTRTLQQFTDADFASMENDLDAVHAADLVVGASIGSSEALRHEATTRAALVLLSPGASYRGLDTADADVHHAGAAYFVASEEDQYAVQSARALDSHHDAGPHAIKIWSGKGHGTNILDDEGRADVVAWIGANAG